MSIRERHSVWLALGLLMASVQVAHSNQEDPIVGVWECVATRADSSIFFVYMVYHADKIWSASSASDLFGSGFSSRGGLQGVWEHEGEISDRIYRSKSIEILYRNHDEKSGRGRVFRDHYGGQFHDEKMRRGPVFRDEYGGRFFVDQFVELMEGPSRLEDTLCAGDNSGIPACNAPDSEIRISQVRDCNEDGNVDPDEECFLVEGIKPSLFCKRMESVFDEGDVTNILPSP